MTPAERQEWERLVVAFGNAEFDCAHWNAEFDCAHWNDELYPHPYAHYLEAARSAKAALTAFVERLTAGEEAKVAALRLGNPDYTMYYVSVDPTEYSVGTRVRVTRIEEGTP